jgi:hypothetical protein
MIKIENGSRFQVTLPDFEGIAGFKQEGDIAQVAYRPTSDRVSPAEAGTKLVIDGQTWEVASSERSKLLRFMRILNLKKAQEEQSDVNG